MATNWTEIRNKRDEMLEEVSPELKNEYWNTAGVYAIYIEDELVYVGESSSLLNRWIAHKLNTLYDFGQKDYKEDKYKIFREAYNLGLKVHCQPLEICENDKYILRNKENEWIQKLNPLLNNPMKMITYYKGIELIEKIQKNTKILGQS